jgi:hypothetical protein
MPPFVSTWDDFTGGYFVGENDNRQPRSTFTGENVAVSINDGSIVPTNIIKQCELSVGPGERPTSPIVVDSNSLWIDSGLGADTFVSNAVQGGREIYFAVVVVSRTGVKTFRVYQLSPASIIPETAGYKVAKSVEVTIDNDVNITNVFTTNESGQVYVYVGAKNKLYKFTGGGVWDETTPSPKTDITITGLGTNKMKGITVANARMIVWSGTTDFIYFSDSLDFNTWPTVNYIAPGYSNNGVIAVVPRYDDILVIKPNAVFSITGVLSTTAAVRQISDVVHPADIRFSSITSQSNTMFFVSNLTHPYYANINYLVGQQSGIAAYQNFGRAVSFIPAIYDARSYPNPTIAASSNGDIVCTYPQNGVGVDGFFAFIRNRYNKWLKLKRNSFSFYSSTFNNNEFTRFYSSVEKANTPSLGFLQNIATSSNSVVFMQVAGKTLSGISTYGHHQRYVSITFGYWNQQQVNAGSDLAESDENFNNVVEGRLVLSQIGEQKASMIRKICVEATLDLDIVNYGDFKGTASMSVSVINGAPEDVNYDPTLNFVSTPKTYSYDLNNVPNADNSYAPTDPFETPFQPNNPYGRLATTRILRFDSDNMGYGYKHNVVINFSGFRIKRVWIEGDTR